MFTIKEKDYRNYRLIGLIAVDYDEHVETYQEEIIKDRLFLQLINGKDRWKSPKVNILPENIDRFVEDIRDCSYQFTTPNDDTINLNDIGVESSSFVNNIGNIEETISSIDVINIPVSNCVLLDYDALDNNFEVLSEDNSYDKIVLFGGIPISFELINKESFDLEDNLEEYDDFITCQYCGDSGYIDGYHLVDSGNASFSRPNNEFCEQCAHSVKQKCDEIRDNKDIMKDIIAKTI